MLVSELVALHHDAEHQEKIKDFLEHMGVKGMKWGVRRQRLLEMHTRIANGNGTALDKARATSHMTALDLVKHKGSLTSYSKQQAAALQASKERVQSGRPNAGDKIAGLLSYTSEDALRNIANKPRAEKG